MQPLEIHTTNTCLNASTDVTLSTLSYQRNLSTHIRVATVMRMPCTLRNIGRVAYRARSLADSGLLQYLVY